MNLNNSTLKLKGKGLFVFSDPGGAKAVLSAAKHLTQSLTEFLVISNREYNFFEDFGIQVKLVDSETIDERAINFEPDFLFLGTSYTSKIELFYTDFFNQKNVPTYAFIDHWMGMKNRFMLESQMILPTSILVIDAVATKNAHSEGLPLNKLIEIGNPYYDFLLGWKSSISRNDFFLSIGITDSMKKNILFAPEPLSNINGIEDFGFDEFQIAQLLSESLDKYADTFNLIIKTHPNQRNVEQFNSDNSNIYIVQNDVDNRDIIFHCDLIIGFYSNFLIEANIFNKKIIRYVGTIQDPISFLNIGEICHDTIGLINILDRFAKQH